MYLAASGSLRNATIAKDNRQSNPLTFGQPTPEFSSTDVGQSLKFSRTALKVEKVRASTGNHLEDAPSLGLFLAENSCDFLRSVKLGKWLAGTSTTRR